VSARIETEQMQSGEVPSTLRELTFRDGYIFALCNLGLYVWQGDLTRGTFNQVTNDANLRYLNAASPTQLQDFVAFFKSGDNLESRLIEINKSEKDDIISVPLRDISGIDRPIFANGID
jgi:hypothetical protein